MQQKQKNYKKDYAEFVEEKEELLKEGKVLRKKMLKFLDRQKIRKVQKFIYQQPNN